MNIPRCPRLILPFLLLPLLVACLHQKPFIDQGMKVPESSSRHQKRQLPTAPAAISAASPPASDKVLQPADSPAFKTLPPLKYRPATGDWAVPLKKQFSKTREVEVAVDEMPLPDFIHYLFTDIFRLNYVVDSRVKRSKELITLNLSRKLSEYQLFGIVTDVLKQHQLSVHVRDDIYYIWKTGKDEDVALGIGASMSDVPVFLGKIQQIIPVKYADVKNLINFLPRSSDIRIVTARQENMLVVTGTREQVTQVVRMVNVLDRPAMRGRFIGMLRLKYWSPEKMVVKLKEILAQEGIPVAARAGGNGVYFSTLERWGTLLFFAAEKEWLERIRYWASLLDVPLDRDEKRYFLYFPESSKATELAESLEKIIGVTTAHNRNEGLDRFKKPEKGASPKQGKATQKPLTAGTVPVTDGEVRISVDENRNALIIYAIPKKYAALELLLKKLDTMPVQVLLEASVVEVTLTDSLQYGLEWYLKNTSQGQTNILQTMGGLGLGSGGLNFSLISDSQKFQLLINALAQKDMIKILQSPRLMVRDGKSASMMVGTEVPVITSEATSPDVAVEGSSGIIRSVQYRSTGVSLQVTPSVHAQGVVSLEITQEVSEAQANNTSDISSPIILNRSITTEVVAGDGQTVLLGGLIKENQSRTVTGVPLLSNIPLLGHLFKTTSNGSDRTELVIMITPHIIRSTQQIDETRKAIFESFQYME